MAAPADDAPAIFSPKAILLTGGAGFIGSFVTEHLVKTYPQVRVS
jgi:nucleoside-diphosphate-sugar epimerase